MRAFLWVASLAILAGCSTTPPAESDVKVAGAEQVLMFGSPPSGSYTTVVVTRDKGYIGSGCAMGFFVDGKLATSLAPAERATLYIPPGPVVFGTAYVGRGLCDGTGGRRERDAVLVPDTKKAYRIFSDQDGNIDVLPTTL
ncbi:hypothetical protein [Bordetella flabilis]|nr:hypothetical protein [Bordetella flabilis]